MTTRPPLRPTGRLTLYSLAALGGVFLWTFLLDYRLYQQFIWPVLSLGVLSLVAAALVATRIRWMLPLGAIVGTLVLVGAFREPFVIMRLTSPETVWTFVATVLIVGLAALAGCSSVVATTRTARTAGRQRGRTQNRMVAKEPVRTNPTRV